MIRKKKKKKHGCDWLQFYAAISEFVKTMSDAVRMYFKRAVRHVHDVPRDNLDFYQ